jgi:UDP-3-O-[3-hydroxymyristoyl] glucosamine N-acyltransferase
VAYTLEQLAEQVAGRVHGDPQCLIHGVGDLADAVEGQLCFIGSEKFKKYLPECKASAVIVNEALLDSCPGNALVVGNPLVAYAKLAMLLTKEPLPAGAVHASAVVSESAQLADSAYVGPNAVIEADVVLGENAYVGANCYVGKDCVVGDDSYLYPNVSLYQQTQIGQRTIVHAGAVIGSDGFGNANENGRWIKIPQLGRVVLGDDVEVGANSTIDRGAMKDTLIADGVKIDNLVHIAHNVQVGENTAIAACVGIAGSAKLGKGVTIGGVSGVAGHIEITDNVHFTGMAMVTRSVKEPGLYSSGIPAEDNRKWRKNVVRFRNLEKLEKRVKELEVKLDND